MIRVGLTGGIGSGKSLVAKVFENLDIPVYYADDEAKKLYANEDVRQQMINIFGNEIYINNENIDKKTLAQKIFSDKNLLAKVNSIVHTALRAYFENWILQNRSAKYIIVETAILFDSGFDKFIDKTITINAPENLRINRCKERGNMSEEEIVNRMKNQSSDNERSTRADFIIVNDELNPILPQILKIHEALSA